MKITNVQPIAVIKPPLKKILKPFLMYKYWLDVLEELVYLKKTDATYRVLFSYLVGELKNKKLIEPYLPEQAQFREQKSLMNLTNDWFTKYIPNWLYVFNQYQLPQKNQVKVLEIGSWEGLSSCFILQALPNSSLVCVDTWEGADEHQSGDAASQEVLNHIESSFDQNLKPYQDRLTKYKGTSYSFFNNHFARREFDLIYVDGSHHTDDVMIDAIKGFEMLKIGGIMIFDDYLWQYYPKPIDNPAGAINAFLKLKKGSYKIISTYYQIIIEKTQDRY